MSDGVYTDIRVERDGPVVWVTIDRADAGNTFRRETTLELAHAFREIRDSADLRAVVLTGSGDKFFCVGGEKSQQDTFDSSAVLPIVDVYELIDAVPKPVIAAVNGYAVGGGNVLHTVCDLTVASEHAIFRQVGPAMGSFDSGYGTWYLEATIGRKRAKEMWYLNAKYTAAEAQAMGLVNEVVPHERLHQRAGELAATLCERGPLAIAGLKAAFSAKHTGVVGQARIAHDQLLTRYLQSEEARELSTAFKERRPPDPGAFNR